MTAPSPALGPQPSTVDRPSPALDPGADGTREGGADRARLARWMERYGPEIRRHLARMVGSDHEADDVLQEVWITAHRRPPDTGPDSNVRAWLYRVATNAALDRLGRERRRRAALDGKEHRLRPEPEPPPDAALAGLDERARARIRERVAALPRKQREAVWLRWAEGLDYAVIARRLGCSRESARANVYNGMKKLRAELVDLWGEEYGT